MESGFFPRLSHSSIECEIIHSMTFSFTTASVNSNFNCKLWFKFHYCKELGFWEQNENEICIQLHLIFS